MYEGSMYGAGLAVFAVWGWVISHQRGGCVEINTKKLADTLGGTVDEIEGAIAFLEKPDPVHSRCKDHEGRHMVREGQYQFKVPAWEYYQTIRDENGRREYNRVMKAVWRARQPGKNSKPPKKRPGVVTGGPLRERQFVQQVADGEEPEARLTAPEAGESGPAG
jgi:hypothetical protein